LSGHLNISEGRMPLIHRNGPVNEDCAHGSLRLQGVLGILKNTALQVFASCQHFLKDHVKLQDLLFFHFRLFCYEA